MKSIKYEIQIPEEWTYDIYFALKQYRNNPNNFKGLLSDVTQEYDDATRIMNYFKKLKDETDKWNEQLLRDVNNKNDYKA